MSIHAFFLQKKNGKAFETIEFLLVTLERMFLIVVTKIVSKRMILSFFEAFTLGLFFFFS